VHSSVPEPGLIIPFSTEVKAGHNFFGKPLLGGHSTYDPTSFSTKIRSSAVQFEGYDASALTKTPRIYLIPVGMDIMFIPTSRNLETRIWNVVDQRFRRPSKPGVADLANPGGFRRWIPSGIAGRHSRYSSFLAYASDADISGVWKGMRLVGRSVWNTQWMLIIPGSRFAGRCGCRSDPIHEFRHGHPAHVRNLRLVW
jgi:hypothetical protein